MVCCSAPSPISLGGQDNALRRKEPHVVSRGAGLWLIQPPKNCLGTGITLEPVDLQSGNSIQPARFLSMFLQGRPKSIFLLA